MSFPSLKWCAAALVLTAIPASAQPPTGETKPILDRILGMKPVPPGESDTPLRKLQCERFNARLAAAQTQARAVQAGAAAPQDLADVVMQVVADGADMEAKPADRVMWLEMRVDALREYEKLAKVRGETGLVSPVLVNLAIAARADAEINLLLFKESLKNEKK